MATKVYSIEYVYTIARQKIEIIPLKIKYLRQAMDMFQSINKDMDEDTIIDILCKCVQISMEQYAPEYSYDLYDILDNFDLLTIYKVLEISMGIKINNNLVESSPDVKPVEVKDGSNWDNFDLAKLETEAFLLGIWKNYDELELSLSIAELMTTISSRRELDYQEKKFLAAIQGIELEDQESGRGQKEWEDLKARVFSKGKTNDANDILSLQGINAQQAGFGIGMGLDYEEVVE